MHLLDRILLSAFAALLATILSFYRLWRLLPAQSGPSRFLKPAGTRSLAVFLGSGGHTAEALALVQTLDFTQYTRRTYIVSEGDSLSATKARDLEDSKTSVASDDGGSYNILTIPRARRVHQPLLTTPFTALRSFATCLKYIFIAQLANPLQKRAIFGDVLLLNGPGTCYILCLAIYANKFFGLASPRTIYVESFARVQSLSLSGKLLRPLVDRNRRFIVQWPDLLADGGRGECYGWLC